jgi:hypothetical protein
MAGQGRSTSSSGGSARPGSSFGHAAPLFVRNEWKADVPCPTLRIMRLVLTSLLFVGMVAQHPANACGNSPSYAVVHSALPTPLPTGAFVAEIEIETSDQEKLYTTGLRARVRRAIAGAHQGERIILRLLERTSCDAPFVNGRSGLLVARPWGREGEALVVRPELVSRYDGFRLPDGFQFQPLPPR